VSITANGTARADHENNEILPVTRENNTVLFAGALDAPAFLKKWSGVAVRSF